MEEIQTTHSGYQMEVERFTQADREDAAATARLIDHLAAAIQTQEQQLAVSWVRLGREFVTVRKERYWLLWGHTSFAEYVRAVGQRFHKGRTQLYQAYSVVEQLLPLVGEDILEQMGMNKAIELKREAKRLGAAPSQELIDRAADPNVSHPQLRQEIFESHHIQPEFAGPYRDLGGYYATNDEWEETQRAFNIAERTDPVISKDIPEWARLKEIMHRLAVTYLVSFEREVEGRE